MRRVFISVSGSRRAWATLGWGGGKELRPKRAGAQPGPRRVRHEPLGRRGAPGSWPGIVCGGGGSGYPMTVGNSALPVPGAWVGQSLFSTRVSAVEGWGSGGTDASGLAKLNALVRSPVTDRRQALRLGASRAKSVSRNRKSKVWSNVSEHTKPPRERSEERRVGKECR